MKHFKFTFLVLLLALYTSSCEEKYLVSKIYIYENTQKPIQGLQVGLYRAKKIFTSESTFDSLILVSQKITDASGLVVFEHPGFEANNTFFIPIYNSDSTSVNAKYNYNLGFYKYHHAASSWGGVNDTIEVTSNYNVILRLIDYEFDHTLRVKWGENSFGMIRPDDIPYFELKLRRGKSYKLQFYKTVNNEEIFIAEETVYVKFIENTTKYVFQLPIITIDIKLGHYCPVISQR